MKGHEETFAVMGIFFTLIVVTVSWHTLRNVNVIYVNCTSINICTIFKIKKKIHPECNYFSVMMVSMWI